jgi:hypothetical protein
MKISKSDYNLLLSAKQASLQFARISSTLMFKFDRIVVYSVLIEYDKIEGVTYYSTNDLLQLVTEIEEDLS